MEIIVRGLDAAKAEERAVQLLWDYHTAVQEDFGDEEVARRRTAYLAHTEQVGRDPLGDA